MRAFYNEIDAFCCAWLSNLMDAGHITPGKIDDRSIVDLSPDDVRGYERVHFFAGIAGWDLALNLAGWSGPVWSGSCPCQPFSAAGKQRGSEDERHLWPAFFHLIRECRPATVLGEQVAGAAGLAWLDHVCADLEGEGYAAAAADLPACSVGAPHRRQRLWWVAYADFGRPGAGRRHDAEVCGLQEAEREPEHGAAVFGRSGATGSVADATGERERADRSGQDRGYGEQLAGPRSRSNGSDDGATGSVADADSQRRDRQRLLLRAEEEGRDAGEVPEAAGSGEVGELGDADDARLEGRRHDAGEHAGQFPAGPASPWRDLAWLPCADGKARPTQPGLFPLVAGLPKGMVRGGDLDAPFDADNCAEARVGRLRAYGNSIVPQLAAEFLAAVMDCRP